MLTAKRINHRAEHLFVQHDLSQKPLACLGTNEPDELAE